MAFLAEGAWGLFKWASSSSSAALSFVATLPPSCRQSVTHAVLTCSWGAPPYYAPGFAPIPACWGWLVVGILIGLLARELLALALAVLWARAPSPPPPKPGGPSEAAAEVLRSWELGGDGEVQAIADRTGLSATALLCKVLHATLRGRAAGTPLGARAEVGRQPRKQPKGPKARP